MTVIVLYLSSTWYHSFPHSKTKCVFRIFDHRAIFLLIAGTCTPFALIVLPGVWGWTLFGIVWARALVGVVMKSVRNVGTSKPSIALYFGIGWLAVLAEKPWYNTLPARCYFWLVVGGAMYSVRVLFFAYDHRVRYHHFIWHVFVMAGTSCHIVTVLEYARWLGTPAR